MSSYLTNNYNNYSLSKVFHIFKDDNALINRLISLYFFLIKTFLFSDFLNRKRFNILKKRLTCFKIIRFFDFNKIGVERSELNVLK